MSALFANVLKQALKTFDYKNQSAFITNFGALKNLMDQLTYRDINLNEVELFSDNSFNQPDKCPCTFIHVFENSDISVSVFVMRSDFTMPLHDHPVMYGILKCFYGKLLINSYTAQKPLPTSKHELTSYDEIFNHRIPVKAEDIKILESNSLCAILTPTERNFHEITAVGGVAAFFDILSPPYDSNIPVYGRRKCKFYRKTQICHQNTDKIRDTVSNLTEQIYLERIPCPAEYSCDTSEVNESVLDCCLSISEEMKKVTSS